MITIKMNDDEARQLILKDVFKNLDIEISGKVRIFTVTAMQFKKHCPVMEAYADGAVVQLCITGGWDNLIDTPEWNPNASYRVLREPELGEVWTNGNGVAFVKTEEHDKWFSLKDSMIWVGEGMGRTYSAPSVKAYIAREIINDADEHQGTAHAALKRAAL